MGSSPVSRGGGGTLGTVDSGFHDGDPPETTSDIDESELRRELLNDPGAFQEVGKTRRFFHPFQSFHPGINTVCLAAD
ncbi:hypothetical protein RUM44_011104 [Polyplax serrata]|uniref:Uncharacterized protein n=1 Tax=Polyplax serrata TaxID=468196 RepID=A0ABR1AP40_POLSC